MERVAPNVDEMTEHMLLLMRGVNAQVFRIIGDRVISGPFKGMQIPEVTPWDDGNASCKLFGSYEVELHGVLARAVQRIPEAVINIGCGEGYYAIGLARLMPDTRVIAIDIDDESRHVCWEYARRNNVRLEIWRGFFSKDEMMNLPPESLFLVDCEAAEIELLQIEACPALVSSDIIVECHDFLDSKISKTLAARFADTHDVEWIKPQLPKLEQYPFLMQSPTVMAVMAVVEKRPMPTLWLACWAKQRRLRDG